MKKLAASFVLILFVLGCLGSSYAEKKDVHVYGVIQDIPKISSSIETDVETIINSMPNLSSNNISVFGPISSDKSEGTSTYGLKINESQFIIIVNPDHNGEMIIGLMPVSLSENGANDIIDAVPLMIRAIDNSVNAAQGYQFCLILFDKDRAHVENNGVQYDLDNDTYLFTATIPIE